MFSKFHSSDSEKQVRILNAALKEFAEKGYKNASTNQIVKEAGISKGLLFHYFNNKKDLYLFLYDHFIEMFLEQIKEHVDWDDKDLLNRNRQIASLKIKLFQKHPEIFTFFTSVFTEEAKEIKNAVKTRKEKFMNNNYKEMLSDIDLTKFKEDLDVEKTLNIITWSLEGFSNRQQEKINGLSLDQINLEETLDELDDYIEVLKKSFYK